MPPEIRLNLHPVNFIIVSGIFQSMILGFVLYFSKKGNASANKIIGLFVFICSLHIAWSLILDLNLEDLFKQVFWFPYSYLLAIGPLLFLYTRTLSENGSRVRTSDFIHFVPLVFEVIAQLFFIREGIRNNIVHYAVPGFLVFRVIEFIGVAFSIFVYGQLSLAFIKVHETALAQNFSSQKDITLSWLYKLIKYLRVVWIFWLVFELSFILFFQFQIHSILMYLLLYLLLGIIAYSTYWIGLQALNKSDTLIEKVSVSHSENPSVYARLHEDEIKIHVERIQRLMEKEKLYLHETLTLTMLSLRLETDPNLVSYLLNNVLHKSFYDYVNELRVEEVKRKIEDPVYAHLKIVEIAYESGFNSKATFNRVFKKLTGKSPSEYRKPAL